MRLPFCIFFLNLIIASSIRLNKHPKSATVWDVLARAEECPSAFYTPGGVGHDLKRAPDVLTNCWTPTPKGYKEHFIDQDSVPLANVPGDVPKLQDLKDSQGWVKIDEEGGLVKFPGGSTCGHSQKIATGVAELLQSTGRPLADMHVLDTGCGVGSLGLYLANEFAVNMIGFAPMDQHASQTFLASERGYPVFADALMPDNRFASPPSQFDATYCCWCRMHFKEYLYEMQRLLKPGGYMIMDNTHGGPQSRVFSASDFEEVHMVRIGRIEGGKFVRGDELTLRNLKFNDTLTDLVTEQKSEEWISNEVMVVYQKITKTISANMCSLEQLETRSVQRCLSDVDSPSYHIDQDAIKKWNIVIDRMAELGVFKKQDRVKSVSLLDANAIDNAFISALRLRSKELWGLPLGAAHTVSVGSPRGTKSKLGGLVSHDWCMRSLANHPRSYNLVFFMDIQEMIQQCRGSANDDVALIVAHLFLEAHRLLRPGGHLVVSSHSATMDEMFDDFGIRSSSKLSLLECFSRTSAQVCVLRAGMD